MDFSTANELIGLNELNNGFDQYKLTEKFRIFDLTKDSQPIVVDGQSYTTSYWTQFNNVNTYTEKDISDIHNTFSSYYHEYLESYSFSGGIPVDAGVVVDVSYNKELKEVYEKIEQKDETVGNSKVWWGKYSLTSAPVFLLPLDSLFEKTFLSLASQPNTDSEQMLYCQTLDTYGTHYSSNVIIGGTFKILSSVMSSYTMKYREKDVFSQMSIGIEYEKMDLNMNYSQATIDQQVDKEYVYSSSYDIYASPYCENYTQWKSAVIENPVVINQTLSPIFQLLQTRINLQHKSENYRKTSEYYIQYGKCPTLAEINTFKSSDSNLAKGLDTVGCGFDSVTLTQKLCLFSLEGMTTSWTNPYDSYVTYQVPPYFYISNHPITDFLNSTTIIKNVRQIVAHSISVDNDDSLFGFGGQSEITEKYYSQLYKDTYYLARSLRQIQWYSLFMYTLPSPPLNDIAKQGFDTIPTSFDIDKDQAYWSQFKDAFGTHVVIKAEMGGLIWAEDFFRSCLTSIHSEEWVIKEAYNKYDPLGCFSDHEKTSDYTNSVSEDFEAYSFSEFSLQGGTENMEAKDWDQWMETVKYNPSPIRKTLMPLSNFVVDKEKKKVIQEYINYYQTQTEKDISEMEKIQLPQQTTCNFSSVQKSTQQQMQEIIDEAKNSLKMADPIVSLLGTGYDVTNGALSLPVLDLDNTNYVMQKPYGETSNLIGIERDIKKWNSASAVYDDFLNFEGKKLTWLNGLYTDLSDAGQLKTAFDFYSQEAMYGIAGKIIKTTNLSAILSKLKFNQYFMEAFNLLPIDRDDEIYELFLAEFGYGATTDVDIGGGFEQQIALKQCAIAEHPNWDWDGLMYTDTPNSAYHDESQLNYYKSHRKLYYSQYRGGNPELVGDFDSWLNSLKQNPTVIKVTKWLSWQELIYKNDRINANFKYYYEKHVNDVLKYKQEKFQNYVANIDNHPFAYAYNTYQIDWEQEHSTHEMENSLILVTGCQNCSAISGAPYYRRYGSNTGYPNAYYYDSQTWYQFDGKFFSVWNYDQSKWSSQIDIGCCYYVTAQNGRSTRQGQKNAVCTGGFRMYNMGVDSTPNQICTNY